MKSVLLLSLAVAAGVTAFGVPTFAADTIAGRVTAAGAPVAVSTVTLWAAGDGAPPQLAQAQTGSDGQFSLSADGNGAILYLIAKGGRPAADKTAGVYLETAPLVIEALLDSKVVALGHFR
jgi:hypothetical protein